ncbi:MAG: protein TolB [Desulfobulbaceae bacterium]|nr:protein TolB [Desulfobulbaceae bacterium]HIJ77828.1 protein TolB [Deltaproteobacteria bacterium]
MQLSTKTVSYFLPSVLLAALLLLLMPTPASTRVYLDITSPGFRKVVMTVPYFIDKNRPEITIDSGKKMAALLGRALTFHGFVDLIDPDSYGGSQVKDWASIGTEFTLLGQYELRGEDIILEIRLVDIQAGQMILGRRYRGKFSNHEVMIKKFCDEVVLKLTGEKGVSLTKIAFSSNASGYKEIYLADVLGNEVQQVTKHKDLAVSPRFSPDGKQLAYTSYHRGNPNLYVTNIDKLTVTRALSRRKGLNMSPAWSPDGTTMAVTLSKDGNPDLFLLDTKGKILRKLTGGEGINVSPTWSPDGKRLAFVSDRSGSPQIYVMDVRTKAVSRITYLGTENTTPSWSPDGELIAYTGRVNSNYQILLIKPEGGTPIQLTQYWGDHESPSWSPDSRQIVFTNKRYDEQKICAIFKSGTGLRTLFAFDGDQFTPQWSPRQDN